MVFPQFFLSWGPNQSHVQRQEGRDVLPAAVGHEASGASDIVMYKMSHIPIYIYANPPLIPTLSGLHACRASIDMNMLKTFASR